MGNMIDYIYTGEVKIYQDRVDRFLSIAQRLQLKGLIVNEDDTVEKNENGFEKNNSENEWKRMENWNSDDAVEQKSDTSVSQSKESNTIWPSMSIGTLDIDVNLTFAKLLADIF